jgi:hypothetical protein
VLVDRLGDKRLLIIVGSAHKVGSTWLDAMIEDMVSPRYDFEGMLIPRSMRQLGGSVDFSDKMADAYLRNLKGIWQFKTHADLYPTLPSICRVITVHRDLRDMCVSATHHLSSLPTKYGGFSEEVKQLPFDLRLQHALNNEYNLGRAEYWWGLKGAMRIMYEDILANPHATLDAVGSYIGYTGGKAELDPIVSSHDFKFLSNRNPGDEDTGSFLRKGIAGDWRNGFTPSNVEEFKFYQGGRWNRLLVSMGYEDGLDW